MKKKGNMYVVTVPTIDMPICICTSAHLHCVTKNVPRLTRCNLTKI